MVDRPKDPTADTDRSPGTLLFEAGDAVRTYLPGIEHSHPDVHQIRQYVRNEIFGTEADRARLTLHLLACAGRQDGEGCDETFYRETRVNGESPRNAQIDKLLGSVSGPLAGIFKGKGERMSSEEIFLPSENAPGYEELHKAASTVVEILKVYPILTGPAIFDLKKSLPSTCKVTEVKDKEILIEVCTLRYGGRILIEIVPEGRVSRSRDVGGVFAEKHLFVEADAPLTYEPVNARIDDSQAEKQYEKDANGVVFHFNGTKIRQSIPQQKAAAVARLEMFRPSYVSK